MEDHLQNEALKVSPVVAVSSATYLGFTLSDWMYIVTIIYMILQITVLVHKLYKGRKKGKDAKNNRVDKEGKS